MVEFQPSKLAMRVRFPLPAPTVCTTEKSGAILNCGCNLVVECHASDLIARVRFPPSAPTTYLFELYRIDRYENQSVKWLIFSFAKNHPNSIRKGWCENEDN